MNSFKQSFMIARCELRETFTDSKMVITLLVLGFIYDNGARKMVLAAQKAGVPLGFLEAFIRCLNDWRYGILFLLGFLFLWAGIPRINNEHIFSVYRAGKKVWLAGELIHLLIVSALYPLMLLGLCILGVSRYSFVGNIWSDYVIDYDLKYKEIVGSGLSINASVFRYDYPYKTALNALLLMILCLLVLGSIVLFFSVINKKIAGMIIVMLLIGCMVIFSNYRIWWMWILPTSHSIISLHHIYVFKKYMVNLSFSYLYLTAVEIVLIILSVLFLRKKNYYK